MLITYNHTHIHTHAHRHTHRLFFVLQQFLPLRAMSFSVNASDKNGSSSVNTEVCSFLREHYPASSTLSLSLHEIARYPLPLLTGATASEVAGVVSEPLPSACSSPTFSGQYDGMNAVAAAIQRYWQTSSAIPSLNDHSSTTSNQAPTSSAWTAHSPFRGCALPEFHAQLRRASTMPLRAEQPNASSDTTRGMLSRIDALCHGVDAPAEFSSAAVAGASRSRKRQRIGLAGTAPAAFQSAVQPLSSNDNDGAVAKAACKAIASEHLAEATEARAPSPTLRSRVNENDDLLDMLLGTSTTAPMALKEEECPTSKAEVVRPAPCIALSQADQNVSATPILVNAAPGNGKAATQRDEHLSNSQANPAASRVGVSVGGSARAHASAAAACDEMPLAGRNVKELKEMCEHLGLLCTGTKAVLIQRISLYHSSMKEREEINVARERAAQQTPNAACPATVSGGCWPARHASGSPPRTVFRYRSPSLPCEISSATVLETRKEVLPAVASATESRTSRRVVPSPTMFLQQLMASQQQQQQQQMSSASASAVRGMCTPALGDDADDAIRAGGSAHPISPLVVSPAASRAYEEAIKSEAQSVRWQWLVDFRERAGGHRGGGRSKHEGMVEAFRRQQVPCTSVMLPSGDFMLAVDLLPSETAQVQQPQSHPSDKAVQPEAQREAGVAEAPMLGHVCSLVVERKTAADLDASVKGSRYAEQRRLLAASPYALVIWLIEGTEVNGGGGGSRGAFFRSQALQRGGFSRSPSPAPDGSEVSAGVNATGGPSPPSSPSSPTESARRRVDSACASLGLHHPGWLVVRTRNTSESVLFLKQLAQQVARQLAEHRLASPPESLHASNNPLSAGAAHLQAAAEDAEASVDFIFRALRRHPRTSLNTPSGDISTSSDNPGYWDRTSHALLRLAPTQTCLRCVGALQRHLRAQTAFPRMLMCVRGCSPSLAALLSKKYGSLMGFWRALRCHGREACDADPDVRRLSTAQKKVFILLTEFLMAKDYY